MTEVIDQAVKNVKTTITNILYMFKRTEKHMDMIKREMEDFNDPNGISTDEKYNTWNKK